MLYKRSSFIKWLKDVEGCEIIPLANNNRKGTILIKNGSARFNMQSNFEDVIDYEEIYIAYKKLYLSRLPGDADLIRVE